MAAAAHALTWTPRDGETVHLRRDNAWRLPAGRYTLRHHAHEAWDLVGITTAEGRAVYGPNLGEHERAGVLTPIGAAELERERQLVALRAAAPKRGARAWGHIAQQHDASALPLFVAVNEPALL